ncbi:MAG: 3-keto-5-aminohexanoate cleavage protein [Deltaproteobacteria bacterium]|nr:3-keto-5-aminohexanoate cleavage protein [Deltaproteobacteria bacterium]
MSDVAIVTCALTGVLTDPNRFPVPVTPEQMAAEAKAAWDAGATIVHVHFRDQTPGLGHLPTWDPDVAGEIIDAIRAACPGILINQTTGVLGPDLSGPNAVMERVKPDIAAMNCGSLNYLRTRRDGQWAWPPILFDNPVEKIARSIDAMYTHGVVPECECFDTGIVRSVSMFKSVGLLRDPIHVSFIMGVASGMPAKPAWLPLLIEELPEGAHFQTIAIGRQEVWDLHRATVAHGGHVRTGLEDTFYLPDGTKAASNGPLVEAMVRIVREGGREPATLEQTRALFGIS